MTALPHVPCHFIPNFLSAITHILNYFLSQTSFAVVHFWLFPSDMQKLIFPCSISFLYHICSFFHIISVFWPASNSALPIHFIGTPFTLSSTGHSETINKFILQRLYQEPTAANQIHSLYHYPLLKFSGKILTASPYSVEPLSEKRFNFILSV